ncbi:hypothetical protein GJA_2932 [Janthinobacterium agaricidamnosum NBRC 102515 = DSM 9628]|uniref:Uncharacterized protein n=1 Tax=Janthinobacterium agaricidamnosum NBRC 102515 = DSM 9628 TaxID=1349767 RepID=W0V888_9BURK|nr:hypothetical protein [Janthinobacterium agaricidamnosum]CDG83558.1 hypothetical protein GJA_2932 [Janthinobacterium agaricidamnosum NBRC 102515 = DSM 9628]
MTNCGFSAIFYLYIQGVSFALHISGKLLQEHLNNLQGIYLVPGRTFGTDQALRFALAIKNLCQQAMSSLLA